MIRAVSLPAFLICLFLVACTTDSDKDAEKSEGDAALVWVYSGNYVIDSVVTGMHARGTLAIGANGGIDFDAGLLFDPSTYMGVYDRLFVTDSYGGPRVQVEISPMGAAPQRRFRLFVDTAAGALEKVAYYPDAASDAGTVVLVSRAP